MTTLPRPSDEKPSLPLPPLEVALCPEDVEAPCGVVELLEEEPGEEPEEELEEDEAGDGFKLFNALYISNRIWL